jgi:L-2,4-diaminobutyrate decarboxylase
MHGLLAARPDFVTIHEPESNILCFRWVGDSAPNDERLDSLNLRLREAYNRAGTGWITTTMLGGRQVLRVTLMNPRTTATDLARTLDDLSEAGRQLQAE